MMLAGIIPGPDEPRDFDPYLDIVVDDIMSLNKLKIYDAHGNVTFKVSTNICLHVFHYPGHKIFHCQGNYHHLFMYTLESGKYTCHVS